MEEMLWQFVKMCGGNATVPLATTVLIFVMARKGYITINKQGDGTGNGKNGNGNGKKLLASICTVPGCHDKVIVTETKVSLLEQSQARIFDELKELPDRIVKRIKEG